MTEAPRALQLSEPLRHVLRRAAQQLLTARASDDIDEASLEADLLYGAASGMDRVHVIAAGGQPSYPEALAAFEILLARRLTHEPLAYILGRREFFGMTFQVGPGCLIPRPETETLVEAALTAIAEHPRARRLVRVADIGTGSGAIALAVAQHAPATKVYGVDVSGEALRWAALNMRRFGLMERVVLLAGDLAEPLSEPIDVLCANLPYVPTDDYEGLPEEIRVSEPQIAVEGGVTGIEIIARLTQQFAAHLAKDAATAIFELGAGQAGFVEDLVTSALNAADRGPLDVRVHRDLRGIRRIVEVRYGYPESPGTPTSG